MHVLDIKSLHDYAIMSMYPTYRNSVDSRLYIIEDLYRYTRYSSIDIN